MSLGDGRVPGFRDPVSRHPISREGSPLAKPPEIMISTRSVIILVDTSEAPLPLADTFDLAAETARLLHKGQPSMDLQIRSDVIRRACYKVGIVRLVGMLHGKPAGSIFLSARDGQNDNGRYRPPDS